MQGKVQTITFENFETVVDGHPIVLLDFWAEWCGPCKMFAPAYEAAAEAYPEIYFGKVDTESATDLAQAFNVRSIPTIMAFRKAELVFEHAGVLPAAAFKALLDRLKSELKPEA